METCFSFSDYTPHMYNTVIVVYQEGVEYEVPLCYVCSYMA